MDVAKTRAIRNQKIGLPKWACAWTPPRGRETLEIYLMWEDSEDGEPTVSACISLGFTTRAERNDFAKLLRKIPSIQSGDDPWPYLVSSKKLTDPSSCVETLGELLNEWLACWPADRALK